MKKYNKPVMEIVELQSRENIAAQSPIAATTYTTTGNVVTTVYNLALMDVNSAGTAKN